MRVGEGAQEQPERAGTEKRAELVRSGFEFGTDTGRSDPGRLQIDSLAERGQHTKEDGQ
jgi:hypothetical protein